MALERTVQTGISWLGIAAIVGGLAACGGGAGSASGVRFGLAAPLEQYIGIQVMRGAELARDRINADGGINGMTLELLAVTDSASPQRAVAVADEFLRDESIVAVIGNVNSGALLAAAHIYDRGLVAVSPSATSPEVSTAGPWIFRVASSDAVNSASLALFALRELGPSAAILYANEPYGRGLRKGFSRAFSGGGGSLLEEYPYIEGQTEDFEAYLLGIKAAGPDLIFIAGLDAGAGLIISQARALGLQMPILGGDGLLGLAGRDSIYDGTYVGLLYHADAPDAASRQFVEAFRGEHGSDPDHFAALGYDAVMLVAQAARAAGVDRKKIRQYLEEVGGRRDAFHGVSGLIAFDENGDPIEKRYEVGQIAGAGVRLVRVEGNS